MFDIIVDIIYNKIKQLFLQKYGEIFTVRVIDSLRDEKFNIHTCALSKSAIHTHAFFELAYVVCGEARHYLNENERVITKGDYFIMDYDAKHSYIRKSDEKFELINCLFLSEFIDKTKRTRGKEKKRKKSATMGKQRRKPLQS